MEGEGQFSSIDNMHQGYHCLLCCAHTVIIIIGRLYACAHLLHNYRFDSTVVAVIWLFTSLHTFSHLTQHPHTHHHIHIHTTHILILNTTSSHAPSHTHTHHTHPHTYHNTPSHTHAGVQCRTVSQGSRWCSQMSNLT